jgi:predicted type IV restriction endonuclease
MEQEKIDELCSLMGRLKSNPRLKNFDEAATKQAVVLPLLRSLGWDTSNVDEVYPEYSVEKKRVDYALRLQGRNEFFLEVKKPGEELEYHEEQLLNYSFRQGVKLAGLTNGITWLFYLPLKEGSWAERKFYAVDIIEQGIEDAAQRFIDILSRQNVESREAFRNAEAIYTSALKHRTFVEKLPEAWNKIITERDQILIELLADTTEKLCGFKPTSEDVSKFLTSQQSSFILSSRSESPLPLRRPRTISYETKEERTTLEPISVDTAVHLKVSPEEALKELKTISHKTFQDVLRGNWHADDFGNVKAQSVCWLFCWAKTGMKSKKTAIASKEVFNKIFDIGYEDFDKKVDHKWAQEARRRPGNIESELTSLLRD